MRPLPPSANLALPDRPLRRFAGAGVAIAIALLVAAVFVAIVMAAGDERPSRIDIGHLVVMTATQAALTTILSLLIGTALAWSLNRLHFPGRGLVVGLFASAIVTPGLVVAFGLLTVWGRAGWINQLATMLTGAPLDISIFGLGGILAAHVILDATFAARILLARLDAIPEARLKTGQSLGLDAWQRFRLIDWPALRPSLPGVGAIIFLLAFTSFPIVLLLGGGPANQTLEVAIYAAVRLDFDLVGAVRLALVQVAICGIVILFATAVTPVPAATGGRRAIGWQDRPMARSGQWLLLILGIIGFCLPLAAILFDGLGSGLGALLTRPSFWNAAFTSLWIGTASAILTVLLALVIGMARAAVPAGPRRLALGAPAYAYLAVPAVVLSLGAFLLVRDLGILPARAAPLVVLVANALLALPFALATLGPPLEAIATQRGRLIRALGLGGWQQFMLVEWPLLGREIGVVLALAFCFSLGDLGVIALFGTQDFATLPLAMYRALGAYRSNDAAGIAAIMLLLTLVAFIGIPRLFERLTDAGR